MAKMKYCKETKLIVAEVRKMFYLDGKEINFLLKKVDEIIRGKQNEKPKLRNLPTKI